jgi:hypothetical protein|tara:strand:+ start:668 stop:1015 length:348 start_codon:yes stop_codon:yes gene_type:complete
MLSKLKKMCSPAIIYFVLSIVTLIVMVISNMGNNRTLCMGEFECPVDNLLMIYLIKIGYILFSTIVLDSLCKNGYETISWFLVFFPILAYFALLGLFMIYRNSAVNMVHNEEYYY